MTFKGIPNEYFAARGVSKSDLVKTKALKLPADPYMHLVLNQFKKPKVGPQWPAPYDQLGSRAHAFLVRSLDAEMTRIAKNFPKIKILHGPFSINRKWGRTTSALMLDPEGCFFELIEIDPSGSYFSRDLKVPSPDEKSWLHFMFNSEDVTDTLPFYQSFDLSHDNRVDFRDGLGFYPYTMEKFAKEHEDAMSMVMDTNVRVEFLRNLNDPSNMHLELCLYKKGKTILPRGQRSPSVLCFRPTYFLFLESNISFFGRFIERPRYCSRLAPEGHFSLLLQDSDQRPGSRAVNPLWPQDSHPG